MRNAIIHSPKERFVFVHYHILKNGGSTIESILEREFGRSFASFHGPDRSSRLDGRDLERFLRCNSSIAAVSSHHLRYPKPDIRRFVLFDCCFLRHPLERLDSLYRYLRNRHSEDRYSEWAKRMSAREFLSALRNNGPDMIGNVQVTQLASGGAFTRLLNCDDLDRATKIVQEMAVPGLVEMFDESLVAAEYFLKPAFPHLSLEFVPRNVTKTRAPEGHNPSDRLMRLWGSDLYEDLVRLNQLDLELYRRAGNEVQRRVRLIPDADNRLLEFRARCAQLRGEECLPAEQYLSAKATGD